MKAAVLTNDKEIVYKDVPTPEPGHNQVKIRVGWSSICGTDLHIYLGEFKSRVTYPRILGHEFSGIVESIGQGVTSLKPGDRVAVDPIIWCNQCPPCLDGQNNVCQDLKLLGIEYDGAFAEYVIADPDKAFKVPDSVSLRDAALAELYALGVHSTRKANIEPGDKVVILGSGRLGVGVLEVIRQSSGASWIGVVDVLDSRLRIARKMGADEVINATKEDPVEKINSLTNGQGVDRVIECIGTYQEIPGLQGPAQQAINMARCGGRVVIMGLGNQFTPVFSKEVAIKELEIVGSRVTMGDFPKALELMKLGKFHTDLIVSETLKLSELGKSFELLEEEPEKYLKILVNNE